MKIAVATLKSASPYSQSRFHNTAKLEKEAANDFEERTWRERCHVGEDGNVFIPPMAFKNCLSEAAKFLSEQIPGKNKQTYTKHFEAGVLVTEPLALPVTKAAIEGEWQFVPSNGKRGGATRVMKCFPKVPNWEGDVTFYILDDTVTKPVFEHTLQQAGQFIGLGRFRPRNNGFYGRFRVEKVIWTDPTDA